MKLTNAIEIGKACGLTTIGECFENIRSHSTNLFEYSKIGQELTELVKELDEFKLKPTEEIDKVVDKLGLEWYYKTEEDKMYDSPTLKRKDKM